MSAGESHMETCEVHKGWSGGGGGSICL
ncbi:uncharacterized protein G2W53_021876 [Senna tora]|uniref:Uncharacterized protein n=1 Tax=Senna tora TaxID=362788 RepID=A0A834WIA2_9FABA|nr:uncharacterized protein G2W53_021876 [Senna tora]